MLPSFLCIFFGLISLAVSIITPSQPTALRQRDLQYKLPDGYTVVRTPGVGELDSGQVYGAIIVALLTLAYEDSSNLTDPISYPYTAITLNISGADETSQYYRQFASYTLYNALQTLNSSNDFTASNFTLQNSAGAIACKVVLGPPSALWQEFLGGSIGGSLSPRSSRHSLPSFLEPRQAARITNETAPLAKLIPLYAPDWYGPESPPQDFFIALATMIVKVSDSDDKDSGISYQTLGKEGYHLNVTNIPQQNQLLYLSNRGVLNLCAYAYGQLAKRLGYGIEPITHFEATLVWTNGTDLINHHVLRYEGAMRNGTRFRR